MALTPHYIGAGPNFVPYTKQVITGDNTTTTFTLVFNAPATAAILVVKNGLLLNPGVDYQLGSGGSTIVFTVAPLGSDTVWIATKAQRSTAPTSAFLEVSSFTGDAVTTAFTFSSAPYNAANVMVFVDGVLQKLTTNYTISGAICTFTAAPDTASDINIVHMKVAATPDWTSIDNTVASFTAIAGGKYLVDAKSTGATCVLPASPTIGDEVSLSNISTAPHNLTADGGANKINNGATTLGINTTALTKRLVYAGTFGWVAY